jgi:hypothetical protein
VAVLVEGDGNGRELSHPDRTTVDGREAKALFVVRPAPACAAVERADLQEVTTRGRG